jgi:uncharacterized membrane protein YecN with MAPEG domain
MELVYFLIMLALLEYFVFLMAVGRARARYKIAAPATTGHPDFERYFRVQANTLEQLIMFIPAILVFAHFVSATWAAGLGLLFVVGRILYFTGYVRAADKRSIGFGLSALPVMVLLTGGLIGAGMAAWRASGLG